MSAPEKLGRYLVVGHLASGGMAEIYLGKLLGPSGFERPVVLKRILPALANREKFVQMFLDEARVVARIQHENVVQVYELGEEDDELFLAMEYLEGESALGLLRRAARDGRRLDPAIGAFIVMRAAAGLHAAHELAGPEGQPLRLVHRDVSPSNVFITYTGGVKVLDFGIAKFSEKATETEAGQLKGKFAYMSPEQCLGEPLDRRSDIFALGTILFELTTGRRLFARDTQLETMKAICERPIPSPRQVETGYPEALDAVFKKACARSKEERYATAAEMRRDLAQALRTMDAPAVPEEVLASLMNELFEDRQAQKHEMLTRVRAGSEITNLPDVEVDVSVEIPVAADATGGAITPMGIAAGQPPRSRAPLLISISALAVLGGIGATIAWSMGSVEPAPTPTVSAEPEVAEPEAALDVAEPVEEPAIVAPAALEAPTHHSLRVASNPPGAEVRVAGELRGRTPIDLQVASAEAPISVELTLDGYVMHSAEFVPNGDGSIDATLQRTRRGTGGGSRGSAGRREPTAPAAPTGESPFRRFN